MITKSLFTHAGFLLLLWSPFSLSISNSQLAVDISAESLARISLYYKGVPVTGNGIEFTLPINGLSQKLERTSSNFYLVGNVNQADIIFEQREFVLPQIYGGNMRMLLDGSFIFGGSITSANQKLRIPVLDNITQGVSANGLKIKFSSQLPSGNYSQGDYASVFTLIVTPVI